MSSFMANGYARASGEPAVLCVIAGPGLTYAVSGIAEAFLDSIPLVVIVDAGAGVRSDGAPGLQAIDQVAMTRPIVKGVVEASSADEIAAATRAAVALATEGEPGPVLLQITVGALRSSGVAVEPAAPPPPPLAIESEVAHASERLLRARRPLLLVGQGAAGAAGDVRRLAEMLRAPVVATTSGRGVVSDAHHLGLVSDVPGTSARTLNRVIERADLVLALGCRLTHNGSRGYALVLPSERLVRVDTSRAVIETAYPASLAVEADVAVFLELLVPALAGQVPAAAWEDDEIETWRRRLEAERPARFDPTLGPGPASAFFATLRKHLPDQGILATDSGLHQYIVRAHFPVHEPRTLLVPSDFQSMGYGVPAAIGGALATGRPAVAVTGDGGFSIVALELLTAVREQVSLTVIVLVDGYLGLIRLSQLARTGRETGIDVAIPDLGLFAASVGASYSRIDEAADTDAMLGAAVGSAGVHLIEVPVGELPGLGGLRARGRALSRVRGAFADDTLRRIRRVVGRS